MARVHLTGELRRLCADHSIVDVDAANVIDLIETMREMFPDFRQVSLSDVTVAIDGEVTPNADFVPLDERSDVHFLIAISGG